MQPLDAVEDCGLIAFESTRNVCEHNRQALEVCVTNNSIVTINEQFWLHPGAKLENIHNFVLNIRNGGALYFVKPPYVLPRDSVDPFANHPISCLNIADSSNITLTSSSPLGMTTAAERGLLHGGGSAWWGIPFLGFLRRLERRPKLLQLTTSTNIVISNLNFQDSPLYTLYLNGVENVQIHNCSIVSRRTATSFNNKKKKSHGLLDLSAFNTDGIDIAGHNIQIRDVDIWTQDDCIAIKDNYLGDGTSRDITIQNVNASGLGFVIGSIGGGTVQHVTFRGSMLYRTFKGIYIKFRDYDMVLNDHSLVQDVLFENVTMVEPEQWAIWMGPAQQAGGNSYNPCAAKPCSLCWPNLPGAQCLAPMHTSLLYNVTLRNVSIINPVRSPGVLLGSAQSPLSNLLFENVVAINHDHSILERYALLKQSFPGLALPVNDPFVRRGAGLILFLLMTLVCLSGYCLLRRRRGQHGDDFVLVPIDDDLDERSEESSSRSSSGPADENPLTMNEPSEPMTHAPSTSTVEDVPQETSSWHKWKKSRCWHVFICIFLMCVMTIMVWNFTLHRKLARGDDYFVCKGVVGGVAKGATWPVPSCFLDDTG